MELEIFNTLFSNIWTIFLVIFFFGGSIFVHELGHFLAARQRGLKIERFSIGFGPKLFGWKKNGVDYRVSLLPLGGYVALPQLSDLHLVEGNSKAKALPPISYTDKILVSVMGAVFNLLFAFMLATLLWMVGQPSSSEAQTTIVGYVPETIQTDLETEVAGPAYIAGIQPGDEVLEIDGRTIHNFKDIQQTIITGSGRAASGQAEAIFKIKRGTDIFTLVVEPVLVQFNTISGDRMRVSGLQPKQDMVIKQTIPYSPAEVAGILPGDTLLSANGTPLYALPTLASIINKDPTQPITLQLQRAKKLITLELQPQLIPSTKPLGKLTLNQNATKDAWIEFLPMYNAKKEVEKPAEPSSPSTLIAFNKGPSAIFKDIKLGDTLISINNQKTYSLQAMLDAANTHTLALNMQGTGGPYTTLLSNTQASLVPPKTQALIGIQLEHHALILHVNPFTQFYDNITMTLRTLGGLIRQSSDVKIQNLMGPPGILRILHNFTTQDFRLVLWFTILFNINLAIINLLPIPVLDGGHMLFATIGKLRRKALPLNFIAATQSFFILLLFGLMIYVSFFDVRRWQGDSHAEEQTQHLQDLYIPTSFPKP